MTTKNENVLFRDKTRIGLVQEVNAAILKAAVPWLKNVTVEEASRVVGNRNLSTIITEAMHTAASNELKEQANPFDVPIILPDPIIVPENYDPETCLATFRQECEKQFGYYNSDSTDANFAKATTITPGRKFQLKLIPIKSGKVVSSEDCLAKLRQEKAVLTSAQGLTLVYRQAKDELPKGKYYPSFDDQEALPFVDGYRRLPCLDVDSAGAFVWSLGGFGSSWDGGYVLVCFCDE